MMTEFKKGDEVQWLDGNDVRYGVVNDVSKYPTYIFVQSLSRYQYVNSNLLIKRVNPFVHFLSLGENTIDRI